jgi:hypothetical protein
MQGDTPAALRCSSMQTRPRGLPDPEEMTMLRPLLTIGLMATLLPAVRAHAAADPVEVPVLFKCHEGKFDFHDALAQLNASLTDARGAVYSSRGPVHDGRGGLDPSNELIVVRSPYTVSAPVFLQEGGVPHACVTVQHLP